VCLKEKGRRRGGESEGVVASVVAIGVFSSWTLLDFLSPLGIFFHYIFVVFFCV
jgi:hypothetical protein